MDCSDRLLCLCPMYSASRCYSHHLCSGPPVQYISSGPLGHSDLSPKRSLWALRQLRTPCARSPTAGTQPVLSVTVNRFKQYTRRCLDSVVLSSFILISHNASVHLSSACLHMQSFYISLYLLFSQISLFILHI